MSALPKTVAPANAEATRWRKDIMRAAIDRAETAPTQSVHTQRSADINKTPPCRPPETPTGRIRCRRRAAGTCFCSCKRRPRAAAPAARTIRGAGAGARQGRSGRVRAIPRSDLAKLTDETLKSAYDCAAAENPCDHVDVTPLETVNKKEQPKFMQEQPKPKPQPPPQQPAAASYSATASYFDAPVEVQDPDLLNELNDPLAVNARPKPRPPQPPDNTRLQQPPPPPQPYVPILDEAAKNAAVRKEVERMIEEANRKDTPGGGAEDDEEARLMQELALVRARKLAAAQVVH